MSKIAEGELAVRITSDDGISGGLGPHPKGAVLRNLSESAYNTLVNTGLAEPVAAGTEVRNASDAADAPAPAPAGSKATGAK